MTEPAWLRDVIVVNESSEIEKPSDANIFRNGESACRYLEHWWVENEEGFALAGDYMQPVTNGLAVSDKKIKEQPDQIKRVLRAMLRSQEFLQNN